jgi:hypothetical protein
MAQTYRTIIDQRNIHHRSELAILDLILPMQGLDLLVEMIVQRPRLLTTC